MFFNQTLFSWVKNGYYKKEYNQFYTPSFQGMNMYGEKHNFANLKEKYKKIQNLIK